jgi:hypothetical protein
MLFAVGALAQFQERISLLEGAQGLGRVLRHEGI